MSSALALLAGVGTTGWAPVAVRPTVVAVLGAPGSGRSTVVSRVCSELSCVCLEPEALLAEAVSSGHALGEAASAMLKAGKVLPSSMWVDLVAAAMEAEGGVGPFVLEGFPSDGSTLEQLEEKVGSSVSVVLRLDCDAETLGSRLAEREG